MQFRKSCWSFAEVRNVFAGSTRKFLTQPLFKKNLFSYHFLWTCRKQFWQPSWKPPRQTHTMFSGKDRENFEFKIFSNNDFPQEKVLDFQNGTWKACPKKLAKVSDLNYQMLEVVLGRRNFFPRFFPKKYYWKKLKQIRQVCSLFAKNENNLAKKHGKDYNFFYWKEQLLKTFTLNV